MYAGRSLWPLIRQVDVYGFFEDASLLDRGRIDGMEATAAKNKAKIGHGANKFKCLFASSMVNKQIARQLRRIILL